MDFAQEILRLFHLVDPVPGYDMTSWRLFPFRMRPDVTLNWVIVH